jgi:ligand-binding SRPBCC domain-containing protein
MSTRTIHIVSQLDAPPERVWAEVSTMRGVNAELGPWLRMTYPREADDLSLADATLGQVLFTSTLLVFGFLPYDRHALRLVEITHGSGFVEESSSWTMRRWRHERRLTPMEGGRSRIEDRVTFLPRIPGVAAVVERLVGAVFRHRHTKLRGRFGGKGD